MLAADFETMVFDEKESMTKRFSITCPFYANGALAVAVAPSYFICALDALSEHDLISYRC